MNIKALLSFFALTSVSCTPFTPIQNVTEVNEIKQIHFMEHTTAIELARELSPSVRETKERGLGACSESGTVMELAIGAMGISKSDAAADALVNLLGLGLDGAGSEELSCQLFINGRSTLERLERAQPAAIVKHCQSTFQELQKQELKGVNVEIEQVCRAEDTVRRAQNAMLEAIKLNALSDWEECYYQVSGGDQLLIPTQSTAAITAAINEARQVRFAENIIFIETVRGLTPSIRDARKLAPCPETRTLELAIGAIGIGKSDAAMDALVNLLGLHLDDAGYRELRCQILGRGDALLARLESSPPKAIAEHCRSAFYEIQKRYLKNTDIEAGQVCPSEDEILSKRNEILNAIKSKAACELP